MPKKRSIQQREFLAPLRGTQIIEDCDVFGIRALLTDPRVMRLQFGEVILAFNAEQTIAWVLSPFHFVMTWYAEDGTLFDLETV